MIEPWAPPTSERLAVIKRLSAREIPTYILWAPAIVPVPMTAEFVSESVRAIAQSDARALSLDALNYRSRQPAGMLRRLARERHAPATEAQTKLIRNEADRRGLGKRLDLVESASVEELEPMLPF
jgi:DNA repair photolyase